MNCKDDLVLVADQLSDAAQAISCLIELFDTAKPKDKERREFLLASRLRLLADTLAPGKPLEDCQAPENNLPELMYELLDLTQREEDLVQKVAHSVGLPEKLRVTVICQVSRLRLLITVLASKILPGPEIIRFLDFPVEA